MWHLKILFGDNNGECIKLVGIRDDIQRSAKVNIFY